MWVAGQRWPFPVNWQEEKIVLSKLLLDKETDPTGSLTVLCGLTHKDGLALEISSQF